VPIYLQITGYIRGAVAAGVYRPGEMVPSLRTLALELTVNPNTVQRAYEELEREGLIEARRGLGMFVTRDGAASAGTQSEAALYSVFNQGIRAGYAARMSANHIRAAFDKALTHVDAQARRKT
jgi:GntR family transcriptional regulator